MPQLYFHYHSYNYMGANGYKTIRKRAENNVGSS